MLPIDQIQVIYNTGALKTIHIKKTWRDRIFSWPWQPWQTSIEVKEPTMYLVTRDTSIFSGFIMPGVQINRKVIIAHPTFQAIIEKELDKQRT